MKIFTRKIDATPRCREGLLRRRGPPRRRGPSRHRQLCLGEPGDKYCGRSGPLRRGVARLVEPICLGGGRLYLNVPTMVRSLCLWPVSGWSRGLVCDYFGLLRGPLCDLFGRVIA